MTTNLQSLFSFFQNTLRVYLAYGAAIVLLLAGILTLFRRKAPTEVSGGDNEERRMKYWLLRFSSRFSVERRKLSREKSSFSLVSV